MLYKKSISEKAFDLFNYLMMIIIMVIMAYPLLHVVFGSFSNPVEISAHRGILLRPLGYSLEAYQVVLRSPDIARGYLNTLFLIVAGVSFSMLINIFAAYGLSRKNVLLQKPFMQMMVFSMYFSGGLIPFYFAVRDVGMDNSLWGMVIYMGVNTFNIILMRTSFMAIPVEYEESMKMDGANDFTILFRIIIPLSMPVIAVMILFFTVNRWNTWYYALIFLRDKSKYPIQLVMREIIINNDSTNMLKNIGEQNKMALGKTIKYAVIVISTIPIMFVYPFLQKYYVKGVMIGGIKG